MLCSAHSDTFVRDNLPPPSHWPELLLDNPDVMYPERLNCAVELLDRHVLMGNGNRIALRWQAAGRRHTMTYRELMVLSNQIAQVLTDDFGLVPGNRLLLHGPNHIMMAASWLGAVKAGLVTVPTMPLLRSGELKKIADKARVQAVLCDPQLAHEFDHFLTPDHADYCPDLTRICCFSGDGADTLDARAVTKSEHFEACDTALDDACLIAFTSGTTGQPKGCVQFHRDVLTMCDTFSKHILQMGADDIVCGTPSLAFTFGLGGLLCFPLRVGASAVLAEKLSPAGLLQLIQDFSASMTFGPPTLYRHMAGLVGSYDLSSLKKSVSAGEALPDATRQLWKQATGIEMIDGLGGTEMMHVYISSRPDQVRRGAIGQVVPGYVAQVVDDDFRPLGWGKVGRLAVKGPTGCRYLNEPRQTQFVQGGWNLPGDIVIMDRDGYFYYQARNDDIIVTAGYNIAGQEVEDALLTHEAVHDCGVIGQADPQRGTIIHAFVVLKPGYEPEPDMILALQDHVKARIAPYKYPRAITFANSLPRTETGKLQRFALRHRLLSE